VTALQPGDGPTVGRLMLGSQLRRLREGAGISRETAGESIRASESKISRLELGRVGFKERDVADLLTLYGVTDDRDRVPFLSLLKVANTPGWWHGYTDVLPDWFQPYIGLEAAATLIRTYEAQFIPGLLQTEDYARAVVASGPSTISPETVERRVHLRMDRQQILTRPDCPRLWVVLDEAALRRAFGGPKVMRAQLEYLLALTDRPRLTLQVIPFSLGGHAAEGGTFSILRFPEPELADMVYIEQLGGAVYLDKREDVDRYLQAMDRLSVDSPPPSATAGLLSTIIDET
jgi:transcriptional regulator with XRE-family HTH domain